VTREIFRDPYEPSLPRVAAAAMPVCEHMPKMTPRAPARARMPRVAVFYIDSMRQVTP